MLYARFWQFLMDGGPLVVPIIFASLISLTVFVERLRALKKERIIPSTAIDRIEQLIAEQRHSDALLLCDENPNPMSLIIAAALRHYDSRHHGTSLKENGQLRIKEALVDVGRFQGALLEQRVEVIGTCASVTPLLGLLGTVLGMITVFQGVATHGVGDPSVFATGIWEALITTAVGLAVAIPAFICYKHILGKIEGLILEMEERAMRIYELLTVSSHSPAISINTPISTSPEDVPKETNASTLGSVS